MKYIDADNFRTILLPLRGELEQGEIAPLYKFALIILDGSFPLQSRDRFLEAQPHCLKSSGDFVRLKMRNALLAVEIREETVRKLM